jgi:hypothetical protein
VPGWEYVEVLRGRSTHACDSLLTSGGVRSTHVCLSVVGELGGTVPELRELSLPCVMMMMSFICSCRNKKKLAQPVGAGVGKRNWSTYGFIADKRRNRLSVDRGRKLVYAHFNVRLLRKVRTVDYHSEYFARDLGTLKMRLRATLRFFKIGG